MKKNIYSGYTKKMSLGDDRRDRLLIRSPVDGFCCRNRSPRWLPHVFTNGNR